MRSILSVVALASSALAAGSVCSQAPYSLVLPLSTYGPAASFCSSVYPASICTNANTTFTSTTTTTLRPNATVATLTTTTATSYQTTTVEVLTFTSTTATFSTSKITGTTTQTTTFPAITETDTATTTTTVTTTVTSAVYMKRDVKGKLPERNVVYFFDNNPDPTDTCSVSEKTVTTTVYIGGPATTSIMLTAQPGGAVTNAAGSSIATGQPASPGTTTCDDEASLSTPSPIQIQSSTNQPAYSGSTTCDDEGSSGSSYSRPTSYQWVNSTTPRTTTSWSRNATIISSGVSSHITTSRSSFVSSIRPSSPSSVRLSTTSVNILSSLWSSVLGQPTSFISTACSCIESHSSCTTSFYTASATATATVVNNVTATASVRATSTSSVTGSSTIFTDTTITSLMEQTNSASYTPTTTITTTSTKTTTTTTYATVTPTGNTCVPGNACYSGYLYHVLCGQRINQLTVQVESTLPNTKDLETCLKGCAGDPQCQAFDYNLQTLDCIYYTTNDVSSLKAQAGANFDSGIIYDTCPGSENIF